MDKIFFDKLCLNISLSAEAKRAAEIGFSKYKKTIPFLTEFIYKTGNYNLLKLAVRMNKESGGIISLCVVLAMCEKSFQVYAQKGISETIFFDTFSDIAIWEEVFFNQTGFHGLDETNWIINHIQLKIFKIGRLQFQPCKMTLPLKVRNKGLPDVFNCLNVHIPRGEPLEKERCNASFESAIEFFNRFYPDYNYDYFFCHSWLLSREMPLMVNKESNMFAFYDMWNKIGFSENSNQPFEYIWQKRPSDLNNLSESSTLQKKTKAVLLSGKEISEGYGYIKKTDFIK